MPHRFSWDWTKSFLGHIEYLAEFSRGTEYCWPFLRRFAPPIFIFVFFARLSRYGTSSVLFIFCSSSFLRFMGTFFCFLSFSFPRFFFGFFFAAARWKSFRLLVTLRLHFATHFFCGSIFRQKNVVFCDHARVLFLTTKMLRVRGSHYYRKRSKD